MDGWIDRYIYRHILTHLDKDIDIDKTYTHIYIYTHTYTYTYTYIYIERERERRKRERGRESEREIVERPGEGSGVWKRARRELPFSFCPPPPHLLPVLNLSWLATPPRHIRTMMFMRTLSWIFSAKHM